MNKFLMLLAMLGFIGAVHAEVEENENSVDASSMGYAGEAETDAPMAFDEGASYESEAGAGEAGEGELEGSQY